MNDGLAIELLWIPAVFIILLVVALIGKQKGKERAERLAVVENEQLPKDPISAEQRKEILERSIVAFAQQGWRVSNRTDTTAQLLKDQKPSCIIAILLFLLGIIPGILYLVICRGTRNLYLTVNPYGKVDLTGS